MRNLLLTIIASLLLGRAPAFGQDTIVLNGLTLPCTGCELRSEDPCQVFLGENQALQTCDAVRRTVLKDIAGGTYDGKSPTIAELRRMLLGDAIPGDEAEWAFAILLSSPTGQRALTQDAFTFADRYPIPLAHALKMHPIPKETLLVLWKLPSKEGIKMRSELRAAIASLMTDLTGDDLFGDLSPNDLTHALAELDSYSAAFQGARPDLASKIDTAREILTQCQTDGSCQNVAIDSAPPEIRRYVQRIQLHQTVRTIAERKLRGTALVHAISETPWQELRTPEAHTLLIEALDDFSTLSRADQTEFLGEKYLPMLELFAKNDPSVASRLSLALFTRAQDLWDLTQPDQAVELLEKSLAISDNEIPGRPVLIGKVFATARWKNEEQYRVSHPTLFAVYKLDKPLFDLTYSQVGGLSVVLLGLALLWLLGGYLYRQRRIALEQAIIEGERVLAQEEAELQVLLRYFSLRDSCTLTDLVRSFRKMAKATHPDLSAGSESDFKALQTKYERTRELLALLRDPSMMLPTQEDEE